MLKKIGVALVYPMTESRVLVPLIVFLLLTALAEAAGLLGRLLLLMTLLAAFRYLSALLEARADGRTPATPDTDYFSIIGISWSLFPLAILLLTVMLTIWVRPFFGIAGVWVILLIASILIPPMMLILVVTHSAVESLNPLAIGRMLKRCGATLWIASLYLIVAGIVIWLVSLPSTTLNNMLQMFVMFSFFSLLGTLAEPYDVISEVRIPDDSIADDGVARNEKARTKELSHAYGFLSRGNYEGGFRHLQQCIDTEADVPDAWSWYFEHMLLWDSKQPALLFAQRYLADLLRHGETIPAVKLMLRCQLIDPSWKPRDEDLAAAIEAANRSNNQELVAVLQRH